MQKSVNYDNVIIHVIIQGLKKQAVVHKLPLVPFPGSPLLNKIRIIASLFLFVILSSQLSFLNIICNFYFMKKWNSTCCMISSPAFCIRIHFWASAMAHMVMNLPAMWETWVQSLGQGTSPGEGKGYPLQYSCLENSVDRGAWRVTICGIAKSRTRLSD